MIRGMIYTCDNCYFKNRRAKNGEIPCRSCVKDNSKEGLKPSNWALTDDHWVEVGKFGGKGSIIEYPVDKKDLEALQKEVISRAYILDEAKKCVCGQREQDYGSPEDNFKIIAELWTAYKKVDFSPVDVSMMMALLKIARIATGTATKDSFVDLAGYAACGGEIKFKEENK